MKNFVQTGGAVTITAPRAVTSGELVQIGDLRGFAQKNAALGELVALVIEGVVSIAAPAGAVVGSSLYVDDVGAISTASGGTGAVRLGVVVAVSGGNANVKLTF